VTAGTRLSLSVAVECPRAPSHGPGTARGGLLRGPVRARLTAVPPAGPSEPQPTTVSHDGGPADRPGARVSRGTPAGLSHGAVPSTGARRTGRTVVTFVLIAVSKPSAWEAAVICG
jgi:hypothetical protein